MQLATLYHAAIVSEGLMIELPVAETCGETSHLQKGLVVAARLKSVVIISVEIQWTTPWTPIGIDTQASSLHPHDPLPLPVPLRYLPIKILVRWSGCYSYWLPT